MTPLKILIVATSNDQVGNTSGRTGLWLEELSAPYYVFKEAGAEITLASPRGGEVPLDPKSQSILIVTRSAKRFLKDMEAMDFLAHSVLLEEVKSEEYDLVFLPGGHGPMWDLADNPDLKKLLESFNRQGKPIGAVCHGVVALIALQDDAGKLLVTNRQLTGFSNTEETASGLAAQLPFLLEDKLLSLGALYSKGPDYLMHVVADSNIVTGQNPASSEEVAKQLLVLLRQHKQKPMYDNPALAGR